MEQPTCQLHIAVKLGKNDDDDDDDLSLYCLMGRVILS